jgi:preprotein translocase subunit SecG
MQLLLIMIIHVLVSVALIVLVLIQRGKGSEMGAAFGAGASGTMFGSQGVTPFMVKLIASLAVIFFCTSLGLNYIVSKANTRQPDLLDMSDPRSPTPASQNNMSKEPLQDQSQQGL